MKILLYCQHVLGIGHFFRSLELCRSLNKHEVIIVSGGPGVDTPMLKHVREVKLPGLMMDADFKSLFPSEKDKDIDLVKKDRQKCLLNLYRKEAPDLLLIEFYPFGRKAFRFEIDPILEGIRNKKLPSSFVVCSLRDILVEKKDQISYEDRVVNTLNSYFDALIVHADPKVVKLDETFSRVHDIEKPVFYSGYVTPKSSLDARTRLRQHIGVGDDDFLIVASAGGGKVGASLLECVVAAAELMETETEVYVQVFTGPFMDESAISRLKSHSNKRIQVSRFTPDFLSYLTAADLSVNMAGYNTCMNIVASHVPALVWPFSQNREQRLRAEKLARLGVLEILEDKNLQPKLLAGLMGRILARRSRPEVLIDLDGASKTAKWLENLIKKL